MEDDCVPTSVGDALGLAHFRLGFSVGGEGVDCDCAGARVQYQTVTGPSRDVAGVSDNLSKLME